MRMPALNLRRLVPGGAVETLKRGLAVAGACAFAALLTGAGLPVLHRLYLIGWLPAHWYHPAFAGLCILPAAAAHCGAAYSGLRGAAWWLAWLPGIAVYAAFPWPANGKWQPLGIFGHAWDWARTIVLHWDAAPPFVFNSFGAFVAMVTVTIVAAGKFWLGAAKAVGRLGPAGAASSALPSATWATRGEVVERFSVPGGIVLGELTDPVRDSPNFAPDRRRSWGGQGQGQLITMSPTDGNGHVLVTSQASGYKSTGLVIPNILTYNDPIVVFDPKCELWARTRKAREDMDFEPVVIDAKNGFDPARLIAALAADNPSAYFDMAKLMIPKGYSGIENAQYFKAAATNLLAALLAYYGEKGSTNILQSVAALLSKSPNDVVAHVQKTIENSRLPFVQNQIRGLEGMDPKFWNSVKTEITNQLMFSEMPDVARYITMEPNSRLPAQVVDPRCDVFLNVPQHVAENFPAMLRVMLGSMLAAAQLIEVNEAPRARRLFLIDEAAKLGNMDILENIRDRGRSIGLHLMMFYQTPGEIETLWGRAGMTSWRDGCSATIMGPVSSRTSAQDISAMIGMRTLRVKTESSSSSSQVLSPMAGSVSKSEQEQLRDVPVITPTEVSQLPRHASIITAAGEKPILASKAIWFTRKGMQGRVRGTEEIRKELAVTGAQDALVKRLEDMARPARDSEAEAREPSLSGAAVAAMHARRMNEGPGGVRIKEDFVPPWPVDGDDDGDRQRRCEAAMTPARAGDPSPREEDGNAPDTGKAAFLQDDATEADVPDPAEAEPGMAGSGARSAPAEVADDETGLSEAETAPGAGTRDEAPPGTADAGERGQAERAVPQQEEVASWSMEESARALTLLQDGTPPAEIAQALGRSLPETEARIRDMGARAMAPVRVEDGSRAANGGDPGSAASGGDGRSGGRAP